MELFEAYLDGIENPENRARAKEVFQWVADTFPTLKPELKWNQPMFTDHGTFIIGFSVSKQHLAVSPEPAVMALFHDELVDAGYTPTSNLFRIKWSSAVNYPLLTEMIEHNILDKANDTTFWRK